MVLYLDDLLIHFSDHRKQLALMLTKLEEYDLKLSLAKCTFATKIATYLGHSISGRCIKPSDDHVKAIKTVPEPTNSTELRVSWASLFFSISLYQTGVSSGLLY